MYIPKHFAQHDFAHIVDLMVHNSFGLLISNEADGNPIATHIPFEIEADEATQRIVLRAHVAKPNPQWKTFAHNNQVLVVFQADHTYISSSWYEKENVPTWNYRAVHVYGKPMLLTEEQLYQSLKTMVDKYEKSSENPISLDTLSPKVVEQNIKGIVGFEIEATDIQAKWKLSQNLNENDFANIIKHLSHRPDENSKLVAESMKKVAKEK